MATTIHRAHSLAAGFSINRDKCFFGKRQVKYLGFIVDENGIRIDPDKLRPILEYPRAKNLKQLRRFLGMCSWFRSYIPNYADIAEPLLKLTRKDIVYMWNEDCEEALTILRIKLTSSPILARPNFEREFILECDASKTG